MNQHHQRMNPNALILPQIWEKMLLQVNIRAVKAEPHVFTRILVDWSGTGQNHRQNRLKKAEVCGHQYKHWLYTVHFCPICIRHKQSGV